MLGFGLGLFGASCFTMRHPEPLPTVKTPGAAHAGRGTGWLMCAGAGWLVGPGRAGAGSTGTSRSTALVIHCASAVTSPDSLPDSARRGSDRMEGQCHPVLCACSTPARPLLQLLAELKWSLQGHLLSCQQLSGILEWDRSCCQPPWVLSRSVLALCDPLPSAPLSPPHCLLRPSVLLTHPPPWTQGPMC